MPEPLSMNRYARTPISQVTTYADGTKRVTRFATDYTYGYWDACTQALTCAYCFTLGAALGS